MLNLSLNSLRARLLRISESEVSFEKRGFLSAGEYQKEHLENIGVNFLRGYHLALDHQGDSLFSSLTEIAPEYRGFSFEGAAMALGLIDTLSFSRRCRLREFVNGSGAAHRYVCHVGYGWVLARLPWCRRNPQRFMTQFDPLLRWLVLDGFGLHEGYFHWKKWLPPSARTPGFGGYEARAFDQGLGRSLWFVSGSDPHRTADLIRGFDSQRHADLWSGIGLACAYAGRPGADELEFLMSASGEHVPHLGQGVTFGAEARQLAAIQMPHTELACQVICGMSAKDAANLTQVALNELPSDTIEFPAYERWRSKVRTLLQESMAPCI